MTPLSGPMQNWLASNREALNARFRMAKRRFPMLDSQGVLDSVATILPTLADSATSDSILLHEVYDLILLHSGRGLLSRGSALSVLLGEAFPKLLRHLSARPTLLPASLSNAAEHLGARGKEFAVLLGALAPSLGSVEQTLDAGTVLAWRLGEARLRDHALKAASSLPDSVALEALGLTGWPDNAAPLAIASLMGDAWHSPRERVSAQTLLTLDRTPRERIVAMIEKLAAPATMPLANWSLCGTVGEFAGFGGSFMRPPWLLNAGAKASRHRFFVRSGDTNFRIDADLFGYVCKPDLTVDFPIQEAPASAGIFKALGLSLGSSRQMLLRDGTLHANGESIQLRGMEGVSSFNVLCDCVVMALEDSHRIRVFAPVRPAL